MSRALRAGLALAAVVGLVACTPAEVAVWTPFARPLPGGAHVPCEQWLGTSRVAGFTDDQIPTEHAVMEAETGGSCDPAAHNRSGATGLMQIMPMWADDCGGSPADLFSPQFNLDCALHVLDVQGWFAWSTYPP